MAEAGAAHARGGDRSLHSSSGEGRDRLGRESRRGGGRQGSARAAPCPSPGNNAGPSAAAQWGGHGSLQRARSVNSAAGEYSPGREQLPRAAGDAAQILDLPPSYLEGGFGSGPGSGGISPGDTDNSSPGSSPRARASHRGSAAAVLSTEGLPRWESGRSWGSSLSVQGTGGPQGMADGGRHVIKGGHAAAASGFGFDCGAAARTAGEELEAGSTVHHAGGVADRTRMWGAMLATAGSPDFSGTGASQGGRAGTSEPVTGLAGWVEGRSGRLSGAQGGDVGMTFVDSTLGQDGRNHKGRSQSCFPPGSGTEAGWSPDRPASAVQARDAVGRVMWGRAGYGGGAPTAPSGLAPTSLGDTGGMGQPPLGRSGRSLSLQGEGTPQGQIFGGAPMSYGSSPDGSPLLGHAGEAVADAGGMGAFSHGRWSGEYAPVTMGGLREVGGASGRYSHMHLNPGSDYWGDSPDLSPRRDGGVARSSSAGTASAVLGLGAGPFYINSSPARSMGESSAGSPSASPNLSPSHPLQGPSYAAGSAAAILGLSEDCRSSRSGGGSFCSPGSLNSSPASSPSRATSSEGAAAAILGIPRGPSLEQFGLPEAMGNSDDLLANAHFHLPQSVLGIVASALQADVTIAAILQNPTRVAETVLCEPPGLITLPLRLSKAVLTASKGKVVDTEGILLPSVLTAALGHRPRRYLGTTFNAEGYEGLCYALWIHPEQVPEQARDVMQDAAQALPLLLANRVRALCCERMGRRFDAILTRMPQAVVFVDDGLGPCLINPAAAELLELPEAGEVEPALVAGAMRWLAQRSEARNEIFRWFHSLTQNPHESIEGTWELQNPRCVLRMRSYPLSGQVTHGRVWLFDDVTAEHDVRSAVEAADRAKADFLAMMSHQLRTPMTGVLGMLDLLRLTPLSNEQAGFVRVMQGSAEGLLQVLNEILDFSKIESGHLTLEEVDFSIGELLEQVSALFQGRLQERKLQLKIGLPAVQDMPVRGDPNRLRQVLTNLVSNAIKFTETGGVSIFWKKVVQRKNLAPPAGHKTTTGHGCTEEKPARLQSGKSLATSISGSSSRGAGDGRPPQAPENGLPRISSTSAKMMDALNAPSGPMAEGAMEEGRGRQGKAASLAADSRDGTWGQGLAGPRGSGREGDRWQGGSSEAIDLASKPAGLTPFKSIQSGPGGEHKTNGGPQVDELVKEKGLRINTGKRASREEKPKPPEKSWFEVRVTDTGIGLSSEQQGRLFKSFSQADSSTTRRFGGTGLGLAICKGLINAMGGDIWIESELGSGSTFAFNVALLPAEDPSKFLPSKAEAMDGASQARALPPTRSLSSEGTSLQVLVAEDNQVNQLLIKKMLRHYGHQVNLVGNGQLAVEAVQNKKYDMILMDLQMPVMDGLTATKAIRSLHSPVSRMPIYALTADVLTKANGTLEEMGLDGYLTKPINWDSLSSVIQEVVASSKSKTGTG